MCSVSKLSQFGARADFYIFFQIYVPLLGRNNSANWPRHLAIKREGAFIIFLRCMTSGIPPLPFKRQAHFHCRFAPLVYWKFGASIKKQPVFSPLEAKVISAQISFSLSLLAPLFWENSIGACICTCVCMYVGKRGEGSSTSHHLSLFVSKVLYTTKKNLPPFLLPPTKEAGESIFLNGRRLRLWSPFAGGGGG